MSHKVYISRTGERTVYRNVIFNAGAVDGPRVADKRSVPVFSEER